MNSSGCPTRRLWPTAPPRQRRTEAGQFDPCSRADRPPGSHGRPFQRPSSPASPASPRACLSNAGPLHWPVRRPGAPATSAGRVLIVPAGPRPWAWTCFPCSASASGLRALRACAVCGRLATNPIPVQRLWVAARCQLPCILAARSSDRCVFAGQQCLSRCLPVALPTAYTANAVVSAGGGLLRLNKEAHWSQGRICALPGYRAEWLRTRHWLGHTTQWAFEQSSIKGWLQRYPAPNRLGRLYPPD